MLSCSRRRGATRRNHWDAGFACASGRPADDRRRLGRRGRRVRRFVHGRGRRERAPAGGAQWPRPGAQGDGWVRHDRDRGAAGERQARRRGTGERQWFSSRILPAYAMRPPKVGEVIPILYLRGLSLATSSQRLSGCSARTPPVSRRPRSRRCARSEEDHERSRKRHLGFTRYAYLFCDGIHVSIRLGEDSKVCLLIVIGVREDGQKELLAVEDGYRESTESWAGVFRDIMRRGLHEPRLVVADGALGAWAALRDAYPSAGEQRCGFHASGNIIDWPPKRLHRARRGCSRRSSKRRPAVTRSSRSRSSVRSTAPSTRRRWPSSTTTGRSCQRSTTTPSSTGAICGPRSH